VFDVSESRSDSILPLLYVLNATSLVKPAATELLAQDLTVNSVDIAIICETWFRPYMQDNALAVNNYSLYRKDRQSRKGGGVCIYVKNSLRSTQLSLPQVDDNNFEVLAISCVTRSSTFIVLGCYHPPRPIYSLDDFKTALLLDFELLYSKYPLALFLFAGDFNRLDCNFVLTDLGLSCLTTGPTHGNNILDKIFVSNADLYHAVAVKSLLKTKHLAVLGLPSSNLNQAKKCTARKVEVYDMRQPNIDKLRAAVALSDLLKLYATNPVLHYSEITAHLRLLIKQCVPAKLITIRTTDPPFITPFIKQLLNKRCRLRKAGHIKQADELAARINQLIYAGTRNKYSNLTSSCSKEFWREINITSGNSCCDNFLSAIGPDLLNEFFAGVSNNPSSAQQVSYVPNFDDDHSFSFSLNLNSLEEYEVSKLLSEVKNTSPGLDSLPAWFFRSCCVELSPVITALLNQSLATGTVADDWRNAVVTPVPKVPKPNAVTDFRPISVTPILSRLTESVIVKQYLRPALLSSDVSDQFAFRPTGSTSAALVYIMHKITFLLETNNYVRCLLIDFSKAFDVVDRDILMAKLNNLSTPVPIKLWIADFLSNRTQVTKVNNTLSNVKPINLGVVQGSVLGPSLFTLMVSDLKPISRSNDLCKYADDLSLLVPENSETSIDAEFRAIREWAVTNKLIINFGKTKEIIFHRPRATRLLSPPALSGIERVTFAKILGIYVNDSLTFSNHVDQLLSVCSQRMFLLRRLRVRGLKQSHLQVVFTAIILSKILYVICAWGGYLSVVDQKRVDSVITKCKKYGFCSETRTFEDLLYDADRKLFGKILNKKHCLNSLLPAVRPIADLLRARGHPFILPQCRRDLYKKSFIVRSLFNFV
jgi:hypothetical protein